MQLTIYTDYSLRVLIYLGMHQGRAVRVQEISDYFRVSHNHMVKVAHNLAQHGLVQTTRGRRGGIRLAPAAEQMRVGDVVRLTEPNWHLVECFNADGLRHCALLPSCRLNTALHQALGQFFSVLDGYTVADLVREVGPPGIAPEDAQTQE